MNKQQIEQQKSEPVTFISSSGVKVIIPHDPSPAACERFMRTILDISAKYPDVR